MKYFEVLFWKLAKHLIMRGYGGNCETSDIDDFPEMYKSMTDVNHPGRCASCRAGEVLEWIDGHIELLEESINIHVVPHDELAGSRAPGWSNLSAEWLKEHPTCAVCGGTDAVVAHHVKPVHMYPELELSKDNLLTLCDSRKYGVRCHLWFGHLGNYRNANGTVRQDAAEWLKKLTSINHGS